MRWSWWLLDRAAAQRPACNPDDIVVDLHRRAQRLQAFRHGGDPVALLDPQLADPGQGGHPLRTGGGHAQHRKFINGIGDQIGSDVDPGQRAAAHGEVSDRLPADGIGGVKGQVGPHFPENLQDSVTPRIDADAGQLQFGARCDQGADDEEGGGRQVAWDGDLGAVQGLSAFDADLRAVHFAVRTEQRQHAFGVIPRRHRFRQAGAALGLEPGEQEGGFDLRACDRCPVGDSPQGGSVDPDRRVAGIGLDACAHLPQGDGNPLHGPLRQRGIPDQRGGERAGRQQAAQQPHGRTGIPKIQRCFRSRQAVGAAAFHHPASGGDFPDVHAHLGERAGGCPAVFAVQDAFQPAGALGKGGDQEGPVADGLVAGQGEGSADLTSRFQSPAVTRVHRDARCRGSSSRS